MNALVRLQARFITKKVKEISESAPVQFIKIHKRKLQLAAAGVALAASEICPFMAPIATSLAPIATSPVVSAVVNDVKDRLESVVERRKLKHWPAERLMRMDDPYESGPRVFVVAAKQTAKWVAQLPTKRPPYLLRTYDISSDTGVAEGSRECAVWEAGMATSAAPTYFPAVRLRSGAQSIDLVDGGWQTTENNPVCRALQEASQIPEWKGRSIGCIVSLGCGRQKTSVLNVLNRLVENATETKAAHEGILKRLNEPTQESEWLWHSGQRPNPALRGTLYARINPRVLDRESSEPPRAAIEMDTTNQSDLANLQFSAEHCYEQLGEPQLRELKSRLTDPQDGALRILSIDGGGIKGLIPAIVIQKIEELCGGRPVHELFDLVCGTSTGGILALGTCVAKRPIKDMIAVYRRPTFWTKRWSYVPKGVGVCAKYEPAFLKSILQAATVNSILRDER
jgi:predicted acylesterase/phospholipase RssA